jgi:hypothetical protein
LVPASSTGGLGIGCGQPVSCHEVLDGLELLRPGLNVQRPAAVLAQIATLQLKRMQIPTEGGHLFRLDAGHRSDLKPASSPRGEGSCGFGWNG